MKLGLGLGFSSSLLSKNKAGKVFIADGHVDFGASVETIAGTASYPNDDYEVIGTGSIGATTFMRSGGDLLSDLGTNCVFVAMEDASGNIEMNITNGYSGSDVTLLKPLGITATKMHQAHRGINGQHLSPKGAAGLAQWLLSKTKEECYLEKAAYALWCGDEFTNAPWAAVSASNIWRVYGGMAANAIDYVTALNHTWGTEKMVTMQSRETIRLITDAQGEGANAIFSTDNKKAMLSLTVGGSQSVDTDLNVTILQDNVETYNQAFNAHVSRVFHVIESTTNEVEVRVTRTNSGTTTQYISIGDIYLCNLDDVAGEETSPVINSTDTVLLIGDSWLDDANVNGTPFDTEFRTKHTGTVHNEAIGGSQITAWKDSVSGWLATYKPDICLIHTGINEYNASMSAATFWAHIKDLVDTITASGVAVFLVKQGCTASNSQSLGIVQMMQEYFIEGRDSSVGVEYADRWPALEDEFILEASANEFTNALSVINLRNKVPTTRVVQRLSDSASLTPLSSAPVDSWIVV